MKAAIVKVLGHVTNAQVRSVTDPVPGKDNVRIAMQGRIIVTGHGSRGGSNA
jgi:hypothetical protein